MDRADYMMFHCVPLSPKQQGSRLRSTNLCQIYLGLGLRSTVSCANPFGFVIKKHSILCKSVQGSRLRSADLSVNLLCLGI